MNYNTIVVLFVIISIIITSKTKYKLRFDANYSSLINKQNENNTEIIYNGIKISCLTISKFVIWNAGTTTLLPTDFEKTDSLMISINDNYTIYDIKILNECNEINGYSINRLSDNKANVNFKKH